MIALFLTVCNKPYYHAPRYRWNIFCDFRNYALDREGRATVVAGTAGQSYVDNIFFNPDNDYEMITINKSM